MSEWAYKWKMLFNPDLTKQTQEVIFSRKNIKTDHPIVCFNEAPVAHTTCQKHLGMHLDEKLNFNHMSKRIAKANKDIGLIHKLAHVLLITICKSFIWPHLYYGDIICDQPNNESFCNLIEGIQYNAALTITGAIKGHPNLRSIMNLVLNLWNLEDGSGDCVYCTKSKPPKFLNICMNYFPQNHILTTLVI